MEDSVFQIFSHVSEPSFLRPWEEPKYYNSIGSGFCIEHKGKKYIMTNYHCIHNATDIQLHQPGKEAMNAEEYFSIPECDLSILKTKEKITAPALEFHDKWPAKLSEVFVYGFPFGGYNIGITRGIINRSHMNTYNGAVKLMTLQIDAPINPGNSGGPAICDNKVVGVAFMKDISEDSDNMGYIIPQLIIKYFMKNIGNRTTFEGLSGLYIKWQPINSYISKIWSHDTKHGVLVTESYEDKIKKLSIIRKINDIPINSNGTISIGKIVDNRQWDNEVIEWYAYLCTMSENETVKLEYIYENKISEIDIKVHPIKWLIPKISNQLKRTWIECNGFRFTSVSIMLLMEMDAENINIGNYTRHVSDYELHDKQIIMMISINNSDWNNILLPYKQVYKIDGVKIKNLDDLEKKLKKDKKHIYIEFKNYDKILIL